MIACPCEVCHSTDPRDKRYRSSILVESATTSLVVDTTPDFRTQMLRADVKKLDAVLFTHSHKDHLAGLDDVRSFNYFSGQAMKVFANEITQEVIIREFPYAFTDFRYPGVPEIQLNTIHQEPFLVGDIQVTPILVWHLNLPVLAFRFGKFTYITDANRIDSAEKSKIRGTEIIVVNALRHEKHISHFNLEEAIAFVGELEIPAAYFTHISHQLGKHAVVSSSLPRGISLAHDGLSLLV
jgi:phosphoribosyl 1,2-cyclic phosphate phosphodiesterase